ncbi:PQQ-binding-like beta-propeller repeat protein [Planctomyces sp. SH-PL14]|uniref:PQQ-binding-like beta-propeller repeat protein n=1 Tax=Planctomyces sp. SH-PL14 TaxID=1632864 RepID=UPI00078CC943|nr:PQQ-binding-like beta-propeller repeat protein [Planctomyces sp. SH-PL14]AMV20877.1 outer membrane biogenesis protein BamB [Planctomyces sp. SH-PL14]
MSQSVLLDPAARRRVAPGVLRAAARLLALASLLWTADLRAGSPPAAADWPQFRGPNCSGISTDAHDLPVEFSLAENVRWSAPVGDGIGGAVVAAGRLFVAGMTGKEQVSLFAFEARTGKPLWKRDWPTGELPEVHATNSHASSTPAADAERVYFYFTTLGLITVDARTGADVWKQPLPEPFFVFKWGAGMSPILHGEKVIFCQDDDLSPSLRAFDRRTGKPLWTDDRLDQAVNYSHPVINTVDGKDELVVAGTGMLLGYDPETGERTWKARTLLRNIKTTPVAQDGVVYVSVQSSGIANQWIVAIDQATTGNRDGQVDRAEIQAYVGDKPIPPAFLDRAFARGDLNKDGFLKGEELDVAFMDPENFAGKRHTELGESAAEQFIVAVRGGGHGDVTDSQVLWRHATKHTDHVVSPLFSQGRLMLMKSGGIMTTFQCTDGKPLGGPKRKGGATNYFASPVVGDGKIYMAGENGKVTVLSDTPDYEQLAVNDLEEGIVATPAIHEDALLFRTRTKLICIGKGSTGPAN